MKICTLAKLDPPAEAIKYLTNKLMNVTANGSQRFTDETAREICKESARNRARITELPSQPNFNTQWNIISNKHTCSICSSNFNDAPKSTKIIKKCGQR